MKKTFSFFAVAMLVVFATSFVSCNGGASKGKTHTLEIAADAFKYNENGIWDQTYSEKATSFSSQVFTFAHIGGTTEGYNYWEGFIPSIAQKDGEDYGYYSCVAKGGVKGVGTPYVLAFWSEYTGGASSLIAFTQGDSTIAAVPQEIYFCNSTQSYKDITEGTPFGKVEGFEAGDYFVVKVYGIKSVDAEGKMTLTDVSVDYYLADFRDGKEFVNNAWAKVDLKSLGEVIGLKFSMESTDKGGFGINTATYFALDGLRIKTEK